MSRPRTRRFNQILEKSHYLAPPLAFIIFILAAGPGNAQSSTRNDESSTRNDQSNSEPFTFRRGQSMYIVAFRLIQVPIILDEAPPQAQREYINNDLDAERKVRKRIEEWQYFKVAEKPSQADFVFLVNLDESSIEGLAIPYSAYQRHFKEKFDLDGLRDAAFGRYLIGPLKFPTLGRLTDRLVKQFRERVGP
jgi:hypothetical protein